MLEKFDTPNTIYLAQHHYELFERLVTSWRYDFSPQSVVENHIKELLLDKNYKFLRDLHKRERFAEVELFILKRMASNIREHRTTILPIPDMVYGGSGIRNIDWFCTRACGNYVNNKGTKSCSLD